MSEFENVHIRPSTNWYQYRDEEGQLQFLHGTRRELALWTQKTRIFAKPSYLPLDILSGHSNAHEIYDLLKEIRMRELTKS